MAVCGSGCDRSQEVWKPYVRCEARTLVFFQDLDEAEIFMTHHGVGSIFWNGDGRLTGVGKNLLVATRNGLGYDLAAEVFVCGRCRSSAKHIIYFKTAHKGCDRMVAKGEAVVEEPQGIRVIPAWPVMPVYATQQQEDEILQWMDKTYISTIEEQYHKVHSYTYMSKSEGVLKTNVRECDGILVKEPVDQVEQTYVYQKKSTPARMFKEKRIQRRSSDIADLVTQVARQCEELGKKFEIIGKDQRKKFPKIPLKHTMGYNLHECDPRQDIPEQCEKFIKSYKTVFEPTNDVDERIITHGWSGVILHKQDLPEKLWKDCVDDMFIVLGRCSHGNLQNALNPKCIEGIRYYADQWINNNVPRKHSNCDKNFPVEGVASYALMEYKALRDIHNHQCTQCSKEYRERDIGESLAIITNNVRGFMQASPHAMHKFFRKMIKDNQMRVTERKGDLQLVDIWKSMQQMIHIPNRKIYMAAFCDEYGNFNFFPNTSLGEVFPMFTFAVEQRKDSSGAIITNHRHVDKDEIIETAMEGLYPSYTSSYWRQQTRILHKEQPLDECEMNFGNVQAKICHWEDEIALYTPMILPTPGHLSFGVSNRLMRIQDRIGRHNYVPKNGYCYLYLFACAMNFSDNPNRSDVDIFITQACTDLGPWPVFKDVLFQLTRMAVYYGCYDALVPMILVDHTTKTLHVPGPFGVKQSGMHTLRANNFRTLVDLYHVGDGAMKDYRIGGFSDAIKSIKKCAQSRKEFVRKVNTDQEWLVDMMLSPSLLFTLASLQEAHGVILDDVNGAYDMMQAMLNLKTLGESLGPHLTTQKRVRNYMEGMISKRDSIGIVIRSPNMHADIMSYIDSLQQAILEQQYTLEIDRVEGKQKMLERLDAFQGDCVYNELFNAFGWFSWYGIALKLSHTGVGKRIGTMCENLKDNSLVQWFHRRKRVEDAETSFWRNSARPTEIYQRLKGAIVKRVTENILQTLIVTAISMFGAWVLKKLIKFIKFEKEKGSDIVEFQSKKEEAMISKIIAVCYLVATFFSLDVSTAIYSNLVKFRTIFDTLRISCEYQAGVLDSLQEQLNDIPTFHEFTIYDHESTTSRIDATEQTFEQWLNARIHSGQQGFEPLEGRHLDFELTKEKMVTVATQIRDSVGSEFLVVGHVGCGKSTRFPVELAKNARVLICEPTRVLVTNLADSMNAVMNVNPSVMMRNHRVMTASNITVTTYGYAFHYLYNNAHNLKDYDYILFDEVHHPSAEKIVFYNWLKTVTWMGKIVKLTATANKVKDNIEAQESLDIRTWPKMEPKAFAEEQGKGCKHDATTIGRVILVFVTTFREVDTVSEILRKNPNFTVIKADSRNLRNKTSLTDDISMSNSPNVFVVATNILQNGVNIEADVVVDFGQKIVARIDDDNRMLTTVRKVINKSDRIQRLGRVARMKAGVAIKIGNEIDLDHDLDEVTATEAALLAFGYGIAPVIRNVNMQLFGKITSKQVRTAAKFEMQLAYMVWMVNKDGSQPLHMYELFKPLLLIPGHTDLSPYYNTLDNVNHFRTIKEYASLGYMRQDGGDGMRIPFHNQNVSDEFALKLAHAYAKSQMPTSIRLRVPAVNHRDTAMKLSTKEVDLGVVLFLIDHKLQHEKTILNDLQVAFQSYNTNYKGMLCPGWNAQDKLLSSIGRIRRNVQVLEEQRTRIERAQAIANYDELVQCLDENPSIASHVMYQSGPSKFIDEILLEKRDLSIAPYIAVGSACVVAGITWLVLYWRQRKTKVAFEGKGRRIADAKRQAGRDAKVGRAEEYTYYDQTDTLYAGVQEWNNHTTDWTDRIRKKADAHAMQFGIEPPLKTHRPERRFWHFYGFDPSQYDEVTFKDIVAGFDVKQKAGEMDLEEAFLAMIRNRREDENHDFWDDVRPRSMIAEFRRGDEVREVELKAHNPQQPNKRGLPVGFVERRGEFRQTKPSEIKESAQFESQSMYQEAKPYTHLFTNQVILVGPSGDLNGIVVGCKLLTPYHLARNVSEENDKDVKMVTRFGTYNIGRLGLKNVTKFTMIDLVGLTLPPTFQPRKHLKCFRPPIPGERAVLVISRYGKGGWLDCVSGESEIIPHGEKHEGLWKHMITTKVGDCGAVLVAVLDQKIVGFHSLGGAGQNYFAPVTKEVVDFVNDESELPLVPWKFSDEQVDLGGLIVSNNASKFPITKMLSSIANWQAQTMTSYCGEGFKALGQTNNHLSKRHIIKGRRPQFARFLGEHTKWRELVTPHLGSMQPSALNKEAYYKDMLKYDKTIQVGTADEMCFASAVLNVIKFLEAAGFKKGECVGIFSCGKIFNDLNLDAAMGALYSGKKSEYFLNVSEQEINDVFTNSATKLAENGHGVWSGLLKAELRKAEKVAQNKTRTFTSAPIDILMGAKIVVDDFNKKFYDAHLKGPWTVGINKFNGGWDLLAKSLSKWDWYIDADGSQFDSSITPLLMNAVLNIRLYFMEDDEVTTQMLRNLYTQIINTCILIEDGTVVQKFRGNNSGQPSTVVDNTLCLMIAVEYAKERARQSTYPPMDIRYVCNGDDLLINANAQDRDIIQNRFTHYIKELELNYTFDQAHDDITKVEFMSHKFAAHNGMYIPKLSKSRIIAILEWQRNEEPQAIQSAIIAAYVESFGYDDLMEMIEEFAESQKPVWPEFSLPERESVAQLYLSGNVKIKDLPGMVENQVVWFEANEQTSDELLAAAAEERAKQQTNAATAAQAAAQAAAAAAAQEAARKTTQDQQVQARPEQGNQNRPTRPQQDTDDSLLTRPIRNGLDIADRTGGLVFPKPKRSSKAIYLPPPVQSRITNEQIEKVKKYMPKMESIDNRYSSIAQLNDWIKSAAEAYELEPEAFMSTLLPGWILHCIVNTTSPENVTMNTWRVMNNVGQENEEQLEFDIEPMYRAAKPSLRAIMRHFGDVARLIIEESIRQGRPIMPRAYDKVGVLSAQNMIASCDFIMRKPGDTNNFVQVQNQVIVNRVGGIMNKLFAQAKPSAGTNDDGMRHDAQDVTERAHQFQGVNAFV